MNGLSRDLHKEARHWRLGGSASAEVVAGCLNLTYNGIQSVPGHDDQFVFTDNDTKSTFQTAMRISIGELECKALKVRTRFRSASSTLLGGLT